MNPPGDLSLKVFNKFSQALLYCTVDNLGQQVFEENMNADTNLSTIYSSPILNMTDLQTVLSLLLSDYNPVSAQGFSQRIGKVFFHYLRRTYAEEMMNNSLEFRLSPFHQRVEKSLQLFFQWLKTELNLVFFISGQKTDWKIQLGIPFVNQDCALISYFFKGILLEFFDWMDCHYRYSVDFSCSTQDALQLVCFAVTYLPLE